MSTETLNLLLGSPSSLSEDNGKVPCAEALACQNNIDIPNDELLSHRLILDMKVDPLFTLCHPAVVGQLFERMVEQGFMVCFGVTGQSWGEDPDRHDSESMMQRDLDMMDVYFDLLLRVIMPRVFPIYALITQEKQSSKKRPDKFRRKEGVIPSSRQQASQSRPAGKVCMLREIANSFGDELQELFSSVETLLSLVQGNRDVKHKSLFIFYTKYYYF